MEQSVLTQIRKNKNYTQEKMAVLLGISTAAYNLYENGGRKVPRNIASKIAQVLQVQEEEIFLPETFAICKTNSV